MHILKFILIFQLNPLILLHGLSYLSIYLSIYIGICLSISTLLFMCTAQLSFFQNNNRMSVCVFVCFLNPLKPPLKIELLHSPFKKQNNFKILLFEVWVPIQTLNIFSIFATFLAKTCPLFKTSGFAPNLQELKSLSWGWQGLRPSQIFISL